MSGSGIFLKLAHDAIGHLEHRKRFFPGNAAAWPALGYCIEKSVVLRYKRVGRRNCFLVESKGNAGRCGGPGSDEIMVQIAFVKISRKVIVF